MAEIEDQHEQSKGGYNYPHLYLGSVRKEVCTHCRQPQYNKYQQEEERCAARRKPNN